MCIRDRSHMSPVSPVSPVSPASPVSLAHLWVLFGVIFLSFYSFLQILHVVDFGHQGQEGIAAHQLLVLHPQEEVHVLLELLPCQPGIKALSLLGSRRRVVADAGAWRWKNLHLLKKINGVADGGHGQGQGGHTCQKEWGHNGHDCCSVKHRKIIKRNMNMN